MTAPLTLEPVRAIPAARRDVEVYFADLESLAPILEGREAGLGYLSPEEIARAAAMTSGVAERDRWRLSHIALRLVLERWAGAGVRGASFALGVHGRPEFVSTGAPVGFSLAHSGMAALIAVSSSDEIGADIEALRALKMDPARASALEAAGQALAPESPLPAEPGPRRTLQAWVRFEAVAKAGGRGIGPHLGTLRPGGPVRDGPDFGSRGASDGADGSARAAGVEGAREGQRLVVRDLDAPKGYVGAVAAAKGLERASFFAFPASDEDVALMIRHGDAHHR